MTLNPHVQRLLKEANELPDPVPYVALHEYGPVIHVMRRKNLCWKEIYQWLAERGVDRSGPSVNNAYAKWLAMTNTPEFEPKA